MWEQGSSEDIEHAVEMNRRVRAVVRATVDHDTDGAHELMAELERGDLQDVAGRLAWMFVEVVESATRHRERAVGLVDESIESLQREAVEGFLRGTLGDG